MLEVVEDSDNVADQVLDRVVIFGRHDRGTAEAADVRPKYSPSPA
jgi:hypothetical protein